MHEFPKWKILKLNFLKKTFLSFLNYCSIYYLYPTANCYFLHFPASLHGDTSYTLLKKEVYAGKKTFQLLPYFWNTKTWIYFLFNFHFIHLYFSFLFLKSVEMIGKLRFETNLKMFLQVSILCSRSLINIFPIRKN